MLLVYYRTGENASTLLTSNPCGNLLNPSRWATRQDRCLMRVARIPLIPHRRYLRAAPGRHTTIGIRSLFLLHFPRHHHSATLIRHVLVLNPGTRPSHLEGDALDLCPRVMPCTLPCSRPTYLASSRTIRTVLP